MDRYIGKLLDNRYELLERIGNGGMAVVYKARCHRLNRLVAVKILKPELAEDAEFRRRFHDESQAVAMLSHPNIVSVYDVSRSDNLDYIVMELIDGITLKQYMLKRGTPLNWREALHFIIQIIKALGHAHGRGIIHRDIKPHNVMVLRDGSVKVADFGIARLASSAQSTLTQEALGSVHYISPEQAKGSHIDGRSDIYSAGVVLYEMITGRLPYEGETPVSVAIQHINSIPIPPRELNPELPEALEAITLKAMAPSADQRYASADEMLEALEEFRKNPNISFEYSTAELRDCDGENEPTQVVSSAHVRAESEDSIRRRRSGEEESSMRRRTEQEESRQSGTASRRQSDTESRRQSDTASRRQGDTESRRQSDTASRRQKDTASRRRREEDYDDYDEPRWSFPVGIIAVLVIALFVAGIGWFLWNSFFSPLFTPADTFEVPDLRGKTVEEIFADTSITDVWEIKISDNTIATDRYAYGQVAQQEPGVGTTVKENNLRITIYLSRGEEDGEIRMPSLTNRELREARDALSVERIGLNLEIQEVMNPSDTINENYIISTDPIAGTVLQEGQTVTIVISSGREVSQVTVPTLTNMTLEEARDSIVEHKLVLTDWKGVNHDTIPEGQVVFQSIAPYQEVPEGTGIILQVSLGPARPIESESPPPTDSNPPETTDPEPTDTDPPETMDPEPTDTNPPETTDPGTTDPGITDPPGVDVPVSGPPPEVTLPVEPPPPLETD